MVLKRVLLAICFLFPLCLFAQISEEQSKNHSEIADLLHTAGKLVQYGHQTKTALPLIQALEIFKRIGVVEATEAFPMTSEADNLTEEATQKISFISYETQQLITDATKYAAGDKKLLTLLKHAAESTRGPVGPQPIRQFDVVSANGTNTYSIRFIGGQLTIVIVCGDGDTDLDLFVYDNKGSLVASDTDDGDDCIVTFTPKYSGEYTIIVKNLGRISNRYCITTNK